MSALRLLTLETIKELGDGSAAVLFEQLLKKAVDDCNDRPHVRRARKVTLTLYVAPNEGDPDEVALWIEVKGAAPTQQTKTFIAARKSGNTLQFSAASDSNPHQEGFEFSPESEDQP